MQTQYLHTWKIIIGLILILTTACSPDSEFYTSSPSPTSWSITPYSTPSPKPSTQISKTQVNTNATAPSQPTATPILYEIKKDDTLSVIAFRYSITLDELLTINPGIDPNFLSIGTTIIIPSGEINSPINSTATPYPVQVYQPRCYPTSDDGLWCLAMIKNLHGQPLENVSTSISLYSEKGEYLAHQIALPPNNIVFAESTIPVAVFFPNAAKQYASSKIQLLSALPVVDNSRYLETIVNIEETIITAKSATLRGTIEIPQGDILAQHIFVTLIALDKDGNPIGIRKWEPAVDTITSILPFEVQVFSLGPSIDDVKIISEARP